jgi:spore germination cell wall hydrolase CwlJ-like protein
MAVAQVVLNRVHDSRWPDTVCEVVKEGPTYSWKQDYPIKHKCQFSFYCDGLSDVPKDKRAWNKAIRVAEEIQYTYGLSIPLLDGAVFYHAISVDPKWRREYITQIEDHIFYK